MRILVTNDDGLGAPGLQALESATAGLGRVVVVAPHEERSGAGHAITMHAPLRLRGHGTDRWSCSGTPVDCVYVALHKLCDSPPGLVVSGINKGANLGDDVFYSGTIGAAREAALNGLQSLAVSLDTTTTKSGGPLQFDAASAIAVRVIQQLLARPVPEGVYLNLNVPNLPLAEIEGIRVCRLGRRHYEPLVEQRTDPRDSPYYWIGGSPLGELMGEGTDGWWIARGYATLTPLGLDHTQLDYISELEAWPLSVPTRS
jgi:5'-nucleotidase